MSLKAKLEALIYAAEDPITPDQMAALLKEELLSTVPAGSSPGPTGAETSKPGAAADPAAKRAQQKSEKAALRALLKPFLLSKVCGCWWSMMKRI